MTTTLNFSSGQMTQNSVCTDTTHYSECVCVCVHFAMLFVHE